MKKQRCTICNYEIPEEEKKISSPDGKTLICYKCIETAFLLINPTLQNVENNNHLTNILNKVNKNNPSFFKNDEEDIYQENQNIFEKDISEFYPNKIHEKLNEYIIGQEETKKIISVAIFQHIIRMKSLNNIEEDKILKKSNILLIGNSGSGKTLFTETISKILKLPIVIADASSLTSKGYVGGDVEDILNSLLIKSEYDVELAEKGIVFIDEIDKISSHNSANSKQKDVTGAGVQENLLKIIEGTTVQLKNNKYNHMQNQSQTIELNTKNILFIFGGAFSGLDKIIEEHNSTTSKMGFKTHIEEETNKNHTIVDYILEYGFSPEFLGRIPIISQLKQLTKEDLLKIITEPKNSILKQYQNFFANLNINFTLTEDALENIIENIQNNKIGARALQKIFENIFLNITYNIKNYIGTNIIITSEYLKTEDLNKLKIIEKEENKEQINIT